MEIIFVLAVAMFIEKSCSQVLSISPTCYSNTKTLTFNCDTADHNQAVEFLLNGATKGSCIPGFGCANGITQSGTTTSLIVSFSDSVHNGSWTCKFGPSSTSPALTINDENPCVVTTERTREGTTNSNEKKTKPLYSFLVVVFSPLLIFLKKKKKRHCQYIHVQKTFGIKWSADVCRPGNEKWEKDGKTCQPIYPLNKDKMLINNATVADEGLYVCSFGLNKMTMHYRIVVVENVLYVQEHEDINLGEYIQGEQKWTKGKVERAENGFIRNASKEDEGLYVCKQGWTVPPLKFYLIVYGGKNTEERVYVEKSCDIEFGKSVVTDVTWNGPKNKEKKSLGNNMLVCGASLSDKGIYTCIFEKKEELLVIYNLSVVETVYYIKEGGDITLGENISGSQQWTKNKTVLQGSETGLLISNASAKDEGLYVCKTERPIEIYLIVFGTEETLYVQTGSDIEFGKSIVTNVTWEKNGKTIAWRNSLGNILIRDITVEDEGLYVCSFKSSKLQSKYNLIVVGTEETLYLKIGSNIKFGKSLKTDVVWTKDGKVVEEKACSGNNILITRAEEKDGGIYVCTITSNSMQLKYNLVIVGAIVEVNIKTGDYVTLGKPIKDENNTVMWTKNGKRLENNEGTTFTIYMASIDDNGTYVCKLGTKKTELIYVLTVEPTDTENKIDDHFSIEMTSAQVTA